MFKETKSSWVLMKFRKISKYLLVTLILSLIIGYSVFLSIIYSIMLTYPFSINAIVAISIILYSILGYTLFHTIIKIVSKGINDRKIRKFKIRKKS